MQGIAIAAIFLSISLATLASSFAKIDNIWFDNNLFDIISFTLFFIGFRIKIFLDDILFFKEADFSKNRFKLSFIYTILIWFLWILSAMFVNKLYYVMNLLIAIYLLSIPLIIIQYCENLKFKYLMWIGLNVIYVILLYLAILDDLPKSMCFGLLFLSNLIDMFCSDSFEALTIEK